MFSLYGQKSILKNRHKLMLCYKYSNDGPEIFRQNINIHFPDAHNLKFLVVTYQTYMYTSIPIQIIFVPSQYCYLDSPQFYCRECKINVHKCTYSFEISC